MTDMHSAQSAREDLAFLRGLVDEDWRPGLFAFGAIYVVIGAAIGLHVAITDLTPLQGWPLLAAYIALYGVCSVIISRLARGMQPKTPAGAGVRSRAGGAAVLGAFAAHLVMLAAFVIIAVRQDDAVFLQLAPLVLFASQGAMWLVIHATRPARWHLAEALGWFAATLALAPLVGSAAYGAGLAACVLILMVLPGLTMMRAARAPE